MITKTKKAVKKVTVTKAEKALGLSKIGPEASVFDLNGRVTGKINLLKEIFAAKVNDKLLAQAVRVYLANQRQGTASTKTRGEVAGSTRKIYRQKGTGRARHGSLKAPIYVGGGIVFGPKPRDYSLKLPKQMKREALFSALSSKFAKGELLIIAGFEKLEAKTKELAKTLKNLNLEFKNGKLNQKILLVSQPQTNLLRASRNLKNLKTLPTDLLNAYLVLTCDKVILTKEAVSKIEEIWIEKKL
ncbi:MAG: 50S ribosomal protein L4 [Patescibacteria group bacterium]|nr:50S ribosomal protein L4 [Patescibacteria group bacterium]MCL5095573.1 50S ribosomal protein L4 [Patescibacteria group bacterium]